MSSQQIPIIDLDGGTLADSALVGRVAAAIGSACREIGFFYLVNHGIPANLTADVFAQSQAFFAQEPVVKERLAISRVGHNRGYVGMKSEALDPTRGQDLKEALNIGYVRALDPELAGAVALDPDELPANAWPDLVGFEAIVGDYYRACLGLGRRIHRAIAVDLGLDPSFFADKLDRPLATLRLLHYPPREGPATDLGAGEHTDYGNLTLLATDAVGGLEVKRRDGRWLTAPVIPGAFVVNIGDCLMRWSNDIYVSTPHRVVSPAGRERYSIAFFLDANDDAVVAALPGTVASGASPRHPPTTAGEHLAEKLNASYAFRRIG